MTPLELAPALPPPPPPPAARRATARVVPRTEPVAASGFVAPIEVPERILPEESLDLGVEGGIGSECLGCRLYRLLVARGICAERMLDLVPELTQNDVRYIERALGYEIHAHTL